MLGFRTSCARVCSWPDSVDKPYCRLRTLSASRLFGLQVQSRFPDFGCHHMSSSALPVWRPVCSRPGRG